MRQYLFATFGLGLLMATPVQAAPTFNVTSTVDAADTNPGDGKCEANVIGGFTKATAVQPLKLTQRWRVADVLAGRVVELGPVFQIPGGRPGIRLRKPCTLRAAVEESNATPGYPWPQIKLPAGTYKLTKGQLAITRTVSITGDAASSTIVDGNNSSRHLRVDNGEHSVYAYLNKLTFANGRNNDSFSGGGSISIGAKAYVSLSESVVRDNYSQVLGGAIYVGGDLQLYKTTIADNQVPSNMGGGMMYSGGGILISSNGSAKIKRSTIAGNQASRGGGIRNGGGRLDMENSTVSGNRATFRGGGIMTYGRTEIFQSTITQNQANYGNVSGSEDRAGGGIYNDTGLLFVSKSIVAGNTDNQSKYAAKYSPDCYSKPVPSYGNKRILISYRGNVIGVSNDNCKVYDYSWGLSSNFDQVGTDATPLDPQLHSLTYNGGLTKTHLPKWTSPAIDKGNGYNFSLADKDHDQRGASRPYGANPDAGAVERGATVPAE
ncbi:hypothetical protein IQ266_24505 [filamentous cyanobacterium LEGE 11480]|uniref:CSLREA domain-containing protein n=1 Tax=Romeriopsis navalis LEGE 11480 TaxID=2777977 RepID=A0A928VUS3_9CYAN|nr:choice-of-anchor Q domain-containing protein [Romeriopsis navalis]MBE9032902.1 hypothetical protein [Romeriopsis navalis LEGE 11480]